MSTWTRQEDCMLRKLKEDLNTNEWKLIANDLYCVNGNIRRTPKQCRDRYINFSRFEAKSDRDIWTADELSSLCTHYINFGCKWSEITDHFSSKSENSIKNKFYSVLRKSARKFNSVAAKASNKSSIKKINAQTLLKLIEKSRKILLRDSEQEFHRQFIINLFELQDPKLIYELVKGHRWKHVQENEQDSAYRVSNADTLNSNLSGMEQRSHRKRHPSSSQRVSPKCYEEYVKDHSSISISKEFNFNEDPLQQMLY